MNIKFGQAYQIEEKQQNFFSIFIETDSNDGDYISTNQDTPFLSQEEQAYLWLLQNIIDLENIEDSISYFLIRHDQEDKEIESVQTKQKESYSSFFSSWLTEVLELPFDQYSPNCYHGHTLTKLQVRAFWDGLAYDISFVDENEKNAKEVIKVLIADLEKTLDFSKDYRYI